MRFVRSLGAQRIVLIAIIALPAILLTLRSGIERRDESAAHVRDRGLQLARGISQQSELSVRGAGDLLRPIASLFAQRSVIASVDIPSCVTFLSTFVGPESEYVSVGLTDANGRVRCASTETSPDLELADQPFFTAATSGVPTTRARLVTDVVTGEPALAVVWPVIGPGNRQIGLVFAAIDLQRLQPAELITGLPAGSYATVVDGDGTILARVPDPLGLTGTRIRDEELLEAIDRYGEGTFQGTSAEGVSSLIAFSPIAGLGSGAYALIGIPSEAAFGDANRALRQDLISLAALSLLALAAAWIFSERLVLEPIARLVGVTRRLAAGEFGARFGTDYPPNEIGELGSAFDAMAESLAARQAEIGELNATLERRVQIRTAELEEANRELEAFSYSVSHDLRTPLRTIDGFAEILATEYSADLDAEAQRYVRLVRAAAEQMGRLIDDLLEFSRVGRSALSRRLAPLEPIVRDALDELGPDRAGRVIDIDLQPLGVALVDPALIRQVYVNLLANAIKFTRGREPARVTIGCEQGEGGESVYFVADNGIGFDPTQADTLFGVFQRLHSHEEYEGTGVGLATAQRIVARHRGRIWGDATIDNGATFRFTIGDEPEAEA